MRRILITGANKGIGLALVEAVLESHDDTFVLLGSRDRARGQAAIDGLTRAHPDWADRLRLCRIDVADDASVKAAAEEVAATFGGEPAPLYALVNNAGIGDGGHAAIVGVNTYGVRRTSEAFLPLLDRNKGRIVNVTSGAGPMFVAGCDDARKAFFRDTNATWGQLSALLDECIGIANSTDADATFASRGLGNGEPYGLSKAAANLDTLIFAREQPHLLVNACSPGFIETDLTRRFTEESGKTAAELGMKSPKEGTRAPMHLLFGDLDGNGRYYGSDARRSPLDRYRRPGDPEYTGD